MLVFKNVDTTAGVNKKLIPKYRGSYVQQPLGNYRYEITDIQNFQVTQMLHVGIVDSSRIKIYISYTDINIFEDRF